MTILTISNGGDNFPLKTSSDGRYLTYQNSVPFLLMGDSPQGILACLTPAQMETYLANREGYGINYIQVHLISGDTFGGDTDTFAAQDGTHPFTVDGDISTPNESYFAQVDALLTLAASHSMVICLTAAERIEAAPLWKANGVTKCTNFGTYLGTRYAATPNLIWTYGNDYGAGIDTDLDDCLEAVRDGIAGVDSAHLHTLWTYFDGGSRSDAGWDSRIGLDSGYAYSPQYDVMLDEYARSPAKPVHLVEAIYESEQPGGWPLGTPAVIRHQAWWTMLSGGCGHVYCNGPDTYRFNTGWASRLDTRPGLTHLTYLTALLAPRTWYSLVPDSAHAVLTAGYGTYLGGDAATDDYATCARVADGSLVITYMPTNRTMTFDCTKLRGTFTIRWFDPTNGTFSTDAASPQANTGTVNLSHAGANSAGDADWALVLEA